MNAKKILAILLCVCAVIALAACSTKPTEKTTDKETVKETSTSGSSEGGKEVDYKLGMGIVVKMDSSSSEKKNAQVDATVATVVLGADGKIVACRIDVAQNKMNVADGAVDTAKVFESKMELGDRYGMANNTYAPDNNGDNIVKEWYEQAKAFEQYVVGKTVAEVEAMTTKEVNGHQISTDDALLSAGCTIQITDFRDAVVKACKDDQGMSFKTDKAFTLGVAVKSTAADSKAATDEADGTVKMYSDFAAAVVADGKILAALNDAIQPNITINVDGEIVETAFKATKRELKEAYGMGGKVNLDRNGDGIVKEWFEQSKAFSEYVLGKTAEEVKNMKTKDDKGYMISADDALLSAGCTIQITSMCATMSQAAVNAR